MTSQDLVTSSAQDVTRRKVFNIAWPMVLASASAPLLGLVDLAVIGNLGTAADIGAVAVGAMLFNFIYWGFGFLRMGTTGLVAQAQGAGDEYETVATFLRACTLGIGLGLFLVLTQAFIAAGAFSLLEGSSQVEGAARTYFNIRIWGAPATLTGFCLLGYFLGRQQSKTVLMLQLWMNGINIVLDVVFVVFFDWGVAGIAAGTVIAEVTAALFGLYLVYASLKHGDMRLVSFFANRVWLSARDKWARMIAVNLDIMIRTLCLVFAFAWFTGQGAKSGDLILAANAILMQFVTFAAFFLDGFAFASESLVGAAKGADNRKQLQKAVHFSTQLAAFTALMVSLFFLIAGPSMIRALTDVEEVRQMAYAFLPWAILSPIASIWCYQLDGIFIGATRTADMRNAMMASLGIYMGAWYWLEGLYGNHGLWAALIVFFVARAFSLYLRYPALVRSVSA